MERRAAWSIVFFAALLSAQCAGETVATVSEPTDSDTSGDADADTDTDADADADGDGDGDTDTDADTDADTDTAADTDSDTSVVCIDEDSDAVCLPFDCDDGNDQIFPEAVDIPLNSIDENCDGTDAEPDTDTTSDTWDPIDTETDTTPEDVMALTHEEFCNGTGALGIPGQNLCTGDLAKKVFGFAICSCSNLTVGQVIQTDSTSADLAGQVLSGGSVGVNGNYQTTATNLFHGSLFVGGSSNFGNGHTIAQDMWVQGTAYVGAVATVGGDAHIGGQITCGAPKNLKVAGNLYSPVPTNGAQVEYTLWNSLDPVVVPTPCDCTNPIDIPAIVTAFKGSNDNTYDPFHVVPVDAFTSNPSVPLDISLPCGRYFFKDFAVNNPVTIHLDGRTVIAFEGNISTMGLLTIALETDTAELDLFVSGNFDLNAPAVIGRPASPKSVRIYIGGTSVRLSGSFNLSANLYMPNATFFAGSDLDMSGAVFANTIQNTGAVKVHFDEGILNIKGCQPKVTPCTSCKDCVNPRPACGADLKCHPCTADSECCPPLYCDVAMGGVCRPRPADVD